MDIQNPIFVQIAIDLALFIAVIILLWHANSNIKNNDASKHQEMIADLKIIIAQSQNTADRFLEALEKSRKSLKEIALELDIKEKRVKAILEKFQRETEPYDGEPILPDANFSQSKYAEVINMIRKGYSEEETASATGFPEGEVGLIVDLSRIKNENV
ncbi:MAG: hypothetical protein WCO53_13940 [Deltaproteobacteria bacterium]